jgi:hypothetical protein
MPSKKRCRVGMQADNRPEMRAPQKAILHKERSAMLKIAPLRKKRYPARGARKKQFPININVPYVANNTFLE